MIYELRNIRLHVEKDYDGLSQKAAEIIAKQVNEKPDCVLGLATGSTPVGTYKYLIDKNKHNEIDFKDVRTFNLDEYYPILKSNDQSYDYFMRTNLFDHINIGDDKYNIPDGETDDTSKMCESYDEAIANVGEIDLQLLGIGNNGHIAFIEPGSCFEPNTHKANLDKNTIEANSRFFENIDAVPKEAVTMGVRSIMLSRHIVILASGESKTNAVKMALFGKIDPRVPASILQVHPKVDMIITADIFENMKDLI